MRPNDLRMPDSSRYRVVYVSLADGRTYHTVQLDVDAPWGPEGATLETKHNQLPLQVAIQLRDALNDAGTRLSDAR